MDRLVSPCRRTEWRTAEWDGCGTSRCASEAVASRGLPFTNLVVRVCSQALVLEATSARLWSYVSTCAPAKRSAGIRGIFLFGEWVDGSCRVTVTRAQHQPFGLTQRSFRAAGCCRGPIHSQVFWRPCPSTTSWVRGMSKLESFLSAPQCKSVVTTLEKVSVPILFFGDEHQTLSVQATFQSRQSRNTFDSSVCFFTVCVSLSNLAHFSFSLCTPIRASRTFCPIPTARTTLITLFLSCTRLQQVSLPTAF